MSALVWPEDVLPTAPFDADYGYQLGDARRRTQFEQGTPRQRRLSDLAYDVFTLRWLWSSADYEVFRGFIDAFVRDGDWFYLSVFIDGDYARLQVRFVKGALNRRQRAGGLWEVTAKIETLDTPIMSLADLNALLGLPPLPNALPAWPADELEPEPLNESFAQIIDDGVMRDDRTSGLIEQVRPFRQKVTTLEWSIPLTNAEYALFRAFLFWRVRGGDGWFTMPVFRGGSYEGQPVRIVAGTRNDTRSGGDWIVSAQLEIADLAPLSAEETLEAIMIHGDIHTVADLALLFRELDLDYAGAFA